MQISHILQAELRGSIYFFLEFTNLEDDSPGFGLTVDSTKTPKLASIASTGFALSAWVIACERGLINLSKAVEITIKTLKTLLDQVSQYHGFFAHYINMADGKRFRTCEYSTIDTALCLNGVITAAEYYRNEDIQELAKQLLERVDWEHIVFHKNDRTLFHMAYNPDQDGDYVDEQPGFISQWDMAAEQKMMYLLAANHLHPRLARDLYEGFSRDKGEYQGQQIIVNPGGNLFAYQFSEAWLDTARYVDPDGIDWFNNTRLAALANRSYCLQNAGKFKTYHANSWGMSAGDSPWGYDVSGAEPCLIQPKPNGTVSIFGAMACLPFIPELTSEMMCYLYQKHPRLWGKYGFFNAYNLDVTPPWYSHSIYGIDKGCSMIMIENYLSGLIWNTYTNSPYIQNALSILGFKKK